MAVLTLEIVKHSRHHTNTIGILQKYSFATFESITGKLIWVYEKPIWKTEVTGQYHQMNIILACMHALYFVRGSFGVISVATYYVLH